MEKQSISQTANSVLKMRQTKNLILMINIKSFMSLFLFIMLISCDELPTKPTVEKNRTNKDSTVSQSSQKTNSNDNDFLLGTLKDKLPLNQQEFEDVIPIEINELKLKESKVVESLQMIQATYGAKFKLIIQDYAGTDGKAIQLFNQSYENASGSNQIYKERDGYETKSVIKYGDSELSYIYLNRFLITLEGKKMTPDQLWEFFDPDLLSSLDILDQYNNRNH